MAILKAAEVRSMSSDERAKRLLELREELMNERGVAAMGGSPPSPGKIRQLRTAIARIHTVNRLEELGRVSFTQEEEASGAAAQHARRAQAAPTTSAPAKKKAASKKAPTKKTAGGSKTATKKTTQAKKKASGGKTGGNE